MFTGQVFENGEEGFEADGGGLDFSRATSESGHASSRDLSLSPSDGGLECVGSETTHDASTGGDDGGGTGSNIKLSGRLGSEVSINSHVVSKKKQFSFLNWNIRGFMSKLKEKGFISYVSRFDFICLTETFIEDYKLNLFPSHTAFCKPAVKISKQGRRVGGILCLIRNEYMPFVGSVSVEYDICLCFRIEKSLFDLDRDVFYICTYVPPEHSSYYLFTGFNSGIEVLEDFLIEKTLNENMHMLICGDLNSRTSNKVPFSRNQDVFHTFDRNEKMYENTSRQSQDKDMNFYGKLLLNMCSSLGLCILNGILDGDTQGHLTFISNIGSSVDDYFLLSDDLFNLFCKCSSLQVVRRTESDHLPVEFVIRKDVSHCVMNEREKVQCVEKFKWKTEFAEQFRNCLNGNDFRAALTNAVNLIDVDIDIAIELFNNSIKQISSCMKQKIYLNKICNKKVWFDNECYLARKNVRKLLTKYCRTLEKDTRLEYCIRRKEYKQLLHRKQKEYKASLLQRLVDSATSDSDFWEVVRAVNPKKTVTYNKITTEDWFVHFKHILDKEIDSHEYPDVEIGYDETNDSWYNQPITKEEVVRALKRLKNSKAAGPDDIIGEMLKYSHEAVVDFFVPFFNILFDQGKYPKTWTESIIFPLYKKGDVNDPNNYRGISLSNISSKIYSSIINSRLQKWIEENNTTDEHQAGFKKDYSTIDHIFTLFALVQKQLVKNRKLYVAFIDFEKAFDSISRKLLWPILINNGVNGKLYKCIRSMYESVKARIRNGCDLTDFVRCTQGVKQGDVCSPVLFSLFINDLALEIISKGKHGATFGHDVVELFILLFADDIVLLSETINGLQVQLNSLYRAATKLELKVNMQKSNIVVFRNGGYLASRERWFYGKSEMEVVNTYKYLGVYFSTRLSLNITCEDLAAKAKRALVTLFSTLHKLDNNSPRIFFKLFDAKVQSITQYGSEIWAFTKSAHIIEKVHTYGLKKFLRVDLRTPNDLVYGELSRYPIYLNSYVRCIKFWLRLMRMNEDRLPYKAYRMLFSLDLKGKCTWVTNVRKTLNRYGYSFVWYNKGVESIPDFIKDFRNRIISERWQEWDDHLQTSDRFLLYRSFKSTFDIEKYLTLNTNAYTRNALTRLRFGVSTLSTHLFRYKHTVSCENHVLCQMCKSSDENEVHFVLQCPAYNDLREQYIPQKYWKYPCLSRLCILLASQNDSVLSNLIIFLYKAFKRRNSTIVN